MSTETTERPDLRLSEPGDAERFAHIIYDPRFQGRAAALLTEARIYGTPVEALCGKRWVPTRDPSRFPVCPECKAIKDNLLR